MRPIAAWARYMTSTVIIEPRTGQRSTGPTYGPPETHKAHLARERQIVRTMAGDQVISQQALYLMTSAAILPDARVTLSTGDVGSTESHHLQPAIAAVGRRFDHSGAHHTVLYLG